MAPDYDERYEVRHAGIEDALKRIGAQITEALPEGIAFGLFLTHMGDTPIEKGGAVFWISNAEREGMVEAIKGWIAHSEARAAAQSKD